MHEIEKPNVREISNLITFLKKDEMVNKVFDLTDYDDIYDKIGKLTVNEISLIKGWIMWGHRIKLNNKLIGTGLKPKNI